MVFVRKRTALFGRKLASEKEFNWTKLGTLRSALIYHSTHSFTRREREREKERRYYTKMTIDYTKWDEIERSSSDSEEANTAEANDD